jgi:hypothetical protein
MNGKLGDENVWPEGKKAGGAISSLGFQFKKHFFHFMPMSMSMAWSLNWPGRPPPVKFFFVCDFGLQSSILSPCSYLFYFLNSTQSKVSEP